MVAALASRELGEAVNRKRAQRVMRAHKLLQPTRSLDRRRRPGFFRVTRPDELWHMDMTKVWTAAHGWVYLHVIVDCCTREIAGWTVDVRTRADEAIACVEGGLLGRGVRPGVLVLGTDNGVAVHVPGLPQAPLGPRRDPSPRRLPRPRVPGVHRVLVRAVQEALRLASRMGDHRSRPNRDHRLHRHLPPPTPLRARLPHPRRSRRHLAQTRWTYQPKRPEPTTTTGSTSFSPRWVASMSSASM